MCGGGDGAAAAAAAAVRHQFNMYNKVNNAQVYSFLWSLHLSTHCVVFWFCCI